MPSVQTNTETFFFAHGRTAFWYGLRQLPMEFGQTMLVPDYICHAILAPLDDLGIHVEFYPVDDSFMPDWEELEMLQSTKHAHAFLLVHYFGQPQDIERARTFCNQHGLWLIEDNSHGYGGTLDGRPLGSFGDLGFSSPYKHLQSNSGGILYLNGEPVKHINKKLSTYPVSWSKQKLRQLIRPYPRIKAGLRGFIRSEPDYNDPLGFSEMKIGYFEADRDSKRRILSENWSEHVNFRREAWSTWSQIVSKYALQPVWKKPHPESSPWVIPVYSSNPDDRLYWLRWSRKNGLDFFPWPALPKEVLHSSPNAVDRWQRLLCLPLFQIPKKKILSSQHPDIPQN